MTFLILFLLVLSLQVLHWRCLRSALPRRWSRGIVAGLVLIHVPLAIHVALRLTGAMPEGTTWLRALSRVALAFQVLTLADLLAWGVSSLLWLFHRHLPKEAPAPGEEPEEPGRRQFLRTSVSLSVGVMAVGLVAGAREAYEDPDVVRLDLPFPDLPPGLDGLRLCQLSDMHVGPLLGEAHVRTWRAIVESERPELLLLTGDFVDSLPREVAPFAEVFRDVRPPMGTFAILGNHDYFSDPRPIWDALSGAGIPCLENRHAILERKGARLALLGLQDPMARNGRFRGVHMGPGPSPALAMHGVDPAAFRICLSHRPSDWKLARHTGARLTLSGHTHGGQINPIPGVSSALILGPYARGLYRKGHHALYVNSGVGVVGVPMRIGAPPEITILTLRRG